MRTSELSWCPMADRVPPEIAEGVRMRAGNLCEWCSYSGEYLDGPLHIHHRVYRSRGGPHDTFNMVALCLPHHDRAHAESVWPWRILGGIGRAGYVGPDPVYRRVYEPGAEPLSDRCWSALEEALREDRRPPELIDWQIRRARDFLALDAPGRMV